MTGVVFISASSSFPLDSSSFTCNSAFCDLVPLLLVTLLARVVLNGCDLAVQLRQRFFGGEGWSSSLPLLLSLTTPSLELETYCADLLVALVRPFLPPGLLRFGPSGLRSTRWTASSRLCINCDTTADHSSSSYCIWTLSTRSRIVVLAGLK
jgi:hypothetical protein